MQAGLTRLQVGLVLQPPRLPSAGLLLGPQLKITALLKAV